MSRETSERQDRRQQIIAEYLEAADSGQPPESKMDLKQYPDFADELQAFFQTQAEPLDPQRGLIT